MKSKYICDIYINNKLAVSIQQEYNSDTKRIEIISVNKYITDCEIEKYDKEITEKFGNRFNELLSINEADEFELK